MKPCRVANDGSIPSTSQIARKRRLRLSARKISAASQPTNFVRYLLRILMDSNCGSEGLWESKTGRILLHTAKTANARFAMTNFGTKVPTDLAGPRMKDGRPML